MLKITVGLDGDQRLVARTRRGLGQSIQRPMDRRTNIQFLCMLLDAFDRACDPSARFRLRQAIYIHGIVDAVLEGQVARLPESRKPALPVIRANPQG